MNPDDFEYQLLTRDVCVLARHLSRADGSVAAYVEEETKSLLQADLEELRSMRDNLRNLARFLRSPGR